MAKRHRPKRADTANNASALPRRRATTIMADGRLALADGPANSRLLVYMVGKYLHRMENDRRDIYFGDLDLARIAEIIGMAGVEPGLRDADFREQHSRFDSIVGVEGQRAVNASSISKATGMSRETVRRKLKQLLDNGFIVEKGPASYVLKPGALQEPQRQAIFARGIQQTVQFMNECIEHGALRWTPDRKSRRK